MDSEPKNWLAIVATVLIIIAFVLATVNFFVVDKTTNEPHSAIPSEDICRGPTVIFLYSDFQNGEIQLGRMYFPNDKIRIANVSLSCGNPCVCYEHLEYNNFINEFLKGTSIQSGVKNWSKAEKYMASKGYFFVENPNAQISMGGDISLTGSSSGTTSSFGCKFLFCGSDAGSYSMNLDLKGNINMNGEIKAPISMINESRLNTLENRQDFVKCYLQEFDVYTDTNEKLKKLICGIEKNNVFVIAPIESIEENIKTCAPINVDVIVERINFPMESIEFRPELVCDKIWEAKDGR